MTALQLFSALRLYGADVLLLALGVTLLTALFKKTVFRNTTKKFYVLLPFLIGFVLYAVYRMIATLSVAPLTEEIVSTLEGGFGCGCAATLYYVIYEQFIRGKGSGDAISPLQPFLDGIVPAESQAEAEEELLKASDCETDEERLSYLKETLARYASPPLEEKELDLCAALIAEFLDSIKEA